MTVILTGSENKIPNMGDKKAQYYLELYLGAMNQGVCCRE
jgi:hypothetical protein